LPLLFGVGTPLAQLPVNRGKKVTGPWSLSARIAWTMPVITHDPSSGSRGITIALFGVALAGPRICVEPSMCLFDMSIGLSSLRVTSWKSPRVFCMGSPEDPVGGDGGCDEQRPSVCVILPWRRVSLLRRARRWQARPCCRLGRLGERELEIVAVEK